MRWSPQSNAWSLHQGKGMSTFAPELNPFEIQHQNHPNTFLAMAQKIGCKRTIHFKILVTNYYSRHLIGVDDFEPWPSQQGHLGKHWGQRQSLERHRVGPPAVPSKAQIKLKTSCRLVPPVRNRETKWQMDHTTMTHPRGSKMNCLCHFVGCC